MKVLHVVASLAPRHGGPTHAALGMVRALREQGVDASILSSNDDVGGALDVPLNSWVLHEGVPVCFLPRVQARQHTLVGYTYTPLMPRWLREHVMDYDMIHVHTVFSHPANAAMKAARDAGVPCAVRPLGQLCRWSMQQRGWVKRLQLALMSRRNINGTAFIHTTSRMESEETSELGFTSPCRALPHGLAMPPLMPDAAVALRAEFALPAGRPAVVFMSRFHEKKGIELLLDACARASCPFELILAGVGDSAYVETLKQSILELKIQDRVHWAGFVEGERKWRLLQGADLFVLPSYSENFGIAVLEAVACGAPVIVTDQVALAEEVTRHSLGRVVPVEVAALTQALDDLLAAPVEREAIRSRAIRVAREEFGWPAAARRLIAAYEEAMKSRPTHA